MPSTQELHRQYESLVGQRKTHDNVCQEIAYYVIPRRVNIMVKLSPGQKQTFNLFDSTAIKANYDLAAFTASTMTSSVIRWFGLVMSQSDLAGDKSVKEWLEQCSDRLYHAFQQSNFNSETLEMYTDLGAFGTGCLLLEEKPQKHEGFNGFQFRAEAYGSYVVVEDAEGRVHGLWRQISIPAKSVVDKWPETASEKVKDKSKKPSTAYEMVEVVQAVYPRQLKQYGKTAKLLPFASCYYELETKAKLEEGGYHEFPFFVPRWSKTAGEVYGRGPGHTALPDIKTVNKAVELTLKSWAKIIDPPLLVKDDSVVGRVSLAPAALNVIREDGAIKTFDIDAKFDVNEMLLGQTRQSIRTMFFADQLTLPDKTIITATEVERRLELMQSVLGPTMGRIETEFLQPLINRAFNILLRAGELPQPPEIIVEMQKTRHVDIDIRYEGPLARAQRTGDLQAINKTLGVLLPLHQADPTLRVLDNLDTDAMAVRTAETNGVPQSLIRKPAGVKQIRDSVSQAQEQQANQQNALVDSEARANNAGAAADIASAEKPAASRAA